MSNLNRRNFLKLSGMAGMAGLIDVNGIAEKKKNFEMQSITQPPVNFTRDGIGMNPLEYSSLLLQLAEEGKIQRDSYSRGGTVEELELKFARWLGTESAVFMPTGTLANHIAIREHAGHEKRVIVQAESHIYNDSGDCLQTLSGLNLIPLAPERATFTEEEVQKVLDRTEAGRVSTRVSVISIESPVRRKFEEMFDYKEMKKISILARSEGIKMHLDGARLFLASVHTGIPPAEFSTHFDTVYISLYKCFNAASGAILAGSQEFTKNLFHIRRMFGGGLPQVWPFAAIALHYVDDFLEEYGKALKNAEKFFVRLQEHEAFKIERIPNGTNASKLYVRGTKLAAFREKLRSKNIHLPPPRKEWKGFLIKINVTLNRLNTDELVHSFLNAL